MGLIGSIAFTEDNKLVAIPHARCVFIFDEEGEVVAKPCIRSKIESGSYCCKRIALLASFDRVFVLDIDGDLINVIDIEEGIIAYKGVLGLSEKGFLVCEHRCAFFDFDGSKHWDIDIEGIVLVPPVYYRDYWYVAGTDSEKLMVVKNGEIVKEIRVDGTVFSMAICGHRLAVSASNKIYLYDLTNPEKPREIWRIDGLPTFRFLTFRPDCQYIIGITEGRRLSLIGANKELMILYKQPKDDIPISVAWKNLIVIGTYFGNVIAYNVTNLNAPFPLVVGSKP